MREQREKIQNGRKEDKRFEGEGGAEVLHWQRGARLYSGGIQAGKVRGESHAAGGGDPGVRVLNLEKESSEHLKWTHLEQVQHCTGLPRQVTYPAHTEQGNMRPRLGRTLPLIKSRKRMKRRRQAREKTGDRF